MSIVVELLTARLLCHVDTWYLFEIIIMDYKCTHVYYELNKSDTISLSLCGPPVLNYVVTFSTLYTDDYT